MIAWWAGNKFLINLKFRQILREYKKRVKNTQVMVGNYPHTPSFPPTTPSPIFPVSKLCNLQQLEQTGFMLELSRASDRQLFELFKADLALASHLALFSCLYSGRASGEAPQKAAKATLPLVSGFSNNT